MVGVNKGKKNYRKLPPMLRKHGPPILNDYSSDDETVPPSECEDSRNADVTQVGWRHISKHNIVNDVIAAESVHGRPSRPFPADLRKKRSTVDMEQEPVVDASLRSCPLTATRDPRKKRSTIDIEQEPVVDASLRSGSFPATHGERRQNLRKGSVNEMNDENGTPQIPNYRSLPSTRSENNQSDNLFQLEIEENDFHAGNFIPIRGLYKGGNLDKLTDNRKNKLIVFIPPGKYYRPIGQHERKLASWLGYCARSVGRPSDSWDQNVAKHRSRLWNMVLDYFDVSLESPRKWKRLEELGKVKPDTPEIKRSKFESYCFSAMRVAFRKWRQRLHDKYAKYPSDEERMKHVPMGVSTNDWKDLLKLFGSDDFKEWSETNSNNRKGQKVFASSGPTPFAQVEYQLIDEENGELPDASDVWMATHSILDEEGQNQFRDSESRRIYEEMKRIENEPRNENEPDLTPDGVLQRVFGVKSGYVRGKGLGYKASTKGMVCSSGSSTNNDQVNELKSEIVKLNEKLQVQEEREKAKDQRFESYFKLVDEMVRQNSWGTQNFTRPDQNHSEE